MSWTPRELPVSDGRSKDDVAFVHSIGGSHGVEVIDGSLYRPVGVCS